jgi:hypothetical protein
MADEQAALLAQIKALSGAIDQRKTHSQSGYHTPNTFHHAPHRGGKFSSRGRGASSSSGSSTSRHRSLVLSNASGANESTNHIDTAKEKEGLASSSTATTKDAEKADSSEEGWVKRKSTHNMSLVSTSAFKKT